MAAYYVYSNYHEFSSIKLVNPIFILFIAILFLFAYIFVSLQTIYLLRPLKVNLKFFEAYTLSMMTGFYNLITPFRGGMAARAVYLKKKHNFSYSDFFATLSASYIITFFVAGLIGLIASYLVYAQEGSYNLVLIGIFIVIFLGMIFLMILPDFSKTKYASSISKRPLLQKFLRIINAWHEIKHNKRIISLIFIATTIQLIIATVSLIISFSIFGWQISFADALLISCIGSAGILISITPAGLGIQESITIFTALALGISPSQTIPVSILGRLISTVILFILGPLCSYYLLKRKSKSA